VQESVSTKCLSSVPGCEPVNAVTVSETATVSTQFAKILGLNTITLRAKSTACSPCGVKPLDIVLVLDRTGSMCMTHSGGFDQSCTDLNNAREGMRTFLMEMDPSVQWVGLTVFPPATSISGRCNTPATSNYDSTSSPYTVVPLSTDYVKNGSLNSSSSLVSTITCVKAGGETACYDLDALNGGANRCTAYSFTGPDEVPSITAYTALQGIASSASTFYNQPSASDVCAIFLQVAADLGRGTAALVDDGTT
jgi:hypothetical protein